MGDLNDFVRCYVHEAFSDDDENLVDLLNNFNTSFSDTNLPDALQDDEDMAGSWNNVNPNPSATNLANSYANDADMVSLLNNFNPSLSDTNQTSLLPISFSPIELPQEFNYPISSVNDESMVSSEPTVEELDEGINNVAINGGEEFNHQISNGDDVNMVFSQPIVGDQVMGINDVATDGGEDFQAGLSHVNVGNPPLADQNNVESTHINEGVSFPRWPPMAKPFYCAYCEVLREIIHTNGVEYTTFEIHGRVGLICHGIQRQNIVTGSLETHQEYQMVDFPKKSIDEVKATLMDYCRERNEAGYSLVDDELSPYYETLSIGLDWTDDSNIDQSDPAVPGEEEPEIQRADVETGNQRADVGPRNQKPSLTEQRAKASRMKLSDLSDYFHLTVDHASALVGLCPAVIAKICRREGLRRWPHRKVQSLQKQISVLKKHMESRDEVFRAQSQADIRTLCNKIVEHCAGITPTGLNIY